MNSFQELINKIKKEKVIILGHNRCDVDSFLSGVYLEKYLKSQGVNKVKFMLIDKSMDDSTLSFLKGKYNISSFYGERSELRDAKVIIVDHYDCFYEEAEVVACIDHHPHNEETEFSYYLFDNIGSTLSIIHSLILSCNKQSVKNDTFEKYDFSAQEIMEVISSIAVDTNGFRSDKYTSYDETKINRLKKEYGITNKDLKNIVKEATFLTPLDQELDKLILNGCKHYVIKRKRVASSYIECNGIKDDLLDLLKGEAKEYMRHSNLDYFILIIIDYAVNKTKVYYIGKNKEVYKEYRSVASRGMTVMPEFEKYLK